MYKINKNILVIIFILLIFAFYEGGKYPYIVSLCFILITIFEFIIVSIQKKYIKIYLMINKDSISIGETDTLKIYARSSSFINSCPIEIKLDRPCDFIDDYTEHSVWLGYNKQIEIRYDTKFKVRGIYDLCKLRATEKGLLGIFQYSRTFKSKKHINVYPHVYNINKDVTSGFGLLYGAFKQKSQTYDLGCVKNLRKYVQGDSLKKIHWKISAKCSELYVKEPDTLPNSKLVFFLNMKKEDMYSQSEESEELLIDTCVSTIKYCRNNASSIELFVYNDKQCKFEFNSRKNEYEEMLNYFLINKSIGKDGFSNFIIDNSNNTNNVNMIAILTSVIDDDIVNVIMKLINLGKQVSVIYNIASKEQIDYLKSMNLVQIMNINNILLK